jgi:alkylation response protein AidB-like acyl-CoA dehydrogenase
VPYTRSGEGGEVTVDDVRSDARDWITANWALDITVREWWRRLAEAGLSMPTWPVPFGRGYRSAEGRAVTEELAAVGAIAPPQGALGMPLAAPTILEHGTDDQRARYLPPLLSGVEAWCQLFSEPGAGSDLASLATRAVRAAEERDDEQGDQWIVNGQKVWNSSANVAERGMLLARTDPDVPKHEGITFFLLDMDQPGVEARPLRQMSGEAHFCEVFLTDARVAGADILGGLGDGWRVVRTTLGHERAGFAGRGNPSLIHLPSGEKSGMLDRIVGEVVDEARRPARRERRFTGNAVPALALAEVARERGLEHDPHIRQRLAHYYTLTQLNRYTQLRIRAAAAAGRPIGPEGAITKLAMSRICHTSREVGFAILGADAMLWGPDAPCGGDLQVVGLSSFGTSIGGGTDEVQRNNLAERVLGLPREPQVDRGVPYRDLLVGTQRRAPDPTAG